MDPREQGKEAEVAVRKLWTTPEEREVVARTKDREAEM